MGKKTKKTKNTKKKPEIKKQPVMKNKSLKTLGPVNNFDEYVKPDWWRRIFTSLYLKTDADVVSNDKITRSEIDLFLDILKPSKEDKFLDLCCGQGRHSQELARRGYQNIEGLDSSNYLIQKAKSIVKKENFNIKYIKGDARKLPYSADTFNIVMILGNSFGYFDTINDDLRVLKEVFKILKPWGKILIDVSDGDYISSNFQPRSWEWINKKLFVCRERSLSLDKQRLISREVITHVEKGVLEDQFYAERLYSMESLSELLKAAGFNDISFHGEILTASQRNQDLGMMEKRIIATAVAKKEWSAPKIRTKEKIIKVAILFGDPNKPDALKPEGIFDEDDFYTIDCLKDALRELIGYKFTYLNNHDNFNFKILKLNGKIDYVFNLCDEGFINDPRKELHIPAFLEMCNIPYTGGTPQCLAYCYDKSLVRGIAQEMGINVPNVLFIKPEDNIYEILFNFPVIVKPNFGDSSFGITQKSVVDNIESLINAISEIRKKFGYDKPILVEELLTGSDLSVGIIGNPGYEYQILPIIEEDYSSLPEGLPKICGYEAKWLPDSAYGKITSVPANLPEETERLIIDYSFKLFERLECRDYARFDWRLDSQGVPKLLEVNPNPGWCWDGHLAKMAKFANISYPEMLQAILTAAEKRIGIR